LSDKEIKKKFTEANKRIRDGIHEDQVFIKRQKESIEIAKQRIERARKIIDTNNAFARGDFHWVKNKKR